MSLQDMEGVFDAIASASPLLESLNLTDIPLGADELIRCFERVPRIESLTLTLCNCFNKRLVSALTIVPGRRVQLLPKLTDLYVGEDSIEGQKATDTEIVDFISSWWSLEVDCCSENREY
ncbi:hypothetical protein AX16_008469 [Volvariella volvacea WC 439]|nr:hypothetical protein AX16_008469 [Volvariella volvacea WC 439]